MKSKLHLIAVVLLFVGLTACTPFTALNTFTSGAASQKTAGLSYGAHPRQKLDIYTPLNAKGNAPVVVFFYGGSWNRGEREDYAFVGEALASRGMVAVVADYRLYPEVHYPQILQDAAQAVAWVAKEAPRYGGNPERLFLMGHSAGAYNAAMLALDPRWLKEYGMTPAALQGWIGLAGPYNFIPIQNPEVRPVFFYPHTPPSSQPINHVTSAAPPALLIAPETDKVVNPEENTGQLAQMLRKHGVPVTEKYVDEVGHPLLVATLAGPLQWLAPTLDYVDRFVATNGESALATAPPKAKSD